MNDPGDMITIPKRGTFLFETVLTPSRLGGEYYDTLERKDNNEKVGIVLARCKFDFFALYILVPEAIGWTWEHLVEE